MTYVPTVDARHVQRVVSWRDSDNKKDAIQFEYAQQLIKQANSAMQMSMSMANVGAKAAPADDDPSITLFKSKQGK